MAVRLRLLAGIAFTIVLGACTVPPPADGGPTTTETSTTSTPDETTTTTSTTAPTPPTTSVPSTTTTTEAPPPRIDENFSIAFTGAFGDRFYNPTNASISVGARLIQNSEGLHQELHVGLTNSAGELQTILKLLTPDGFGKLAVGTYANALRWPYNEPDRPAITLQQMGFCTEEFGDFEIRDIRWDGPYLTSIWVTFRRYCGQSLGDHQVTFGELRLGYPPADYDVSPQVVRWPPAHTYSALPAQEVPVHVRPTADAAIEATGVAISGAHAADFQIRENGCSGVIGADGCVVRVGFEPQSAGPRHASLDVTTSSGTTAVSLDAAGSVGVSQWSLDVDYEDPFREDLSLVMPETGTVGVPYEIRSAAVPDDRLAWRASFRLSPSGTFAEGQEYTRAEDGSGLQISLSKGNAACVVDQATASFDDLEFSSPDDNLAVLDATFEVHCRANYGHTARGRIQFHDRDDETPPDAPTDLTAVRDGDRLDLEWTPPDAADLAGVIVRGYSGDNAPGAPDAGEFLYVGTGDSTTVALPSTGLGTLAVWAYDSTGNIGDPYEVRLQP